MSRQSETKQNSSFSKSPGFLVDMGWMRRHTISRQSVSGYFKQSWLEPVTSGVYRRPFSSDANPEAVIGWKITLLSAVWLMQHKLHVGGAGSLFARAYPSARQCQRFVSTHGPIANLFLLHRKHLTAEDHRKLRADAITTLRDISLLIDA